MRNRWSRLVAAAAGGGRLFLRRDGPVYSAAIAFNVLLSSIPVLFLVFAAVSVLFGEDDLPFRQLAQMLSTALPYGSQVLVSNLRKLMRSASAFGVAGVLMLFLSSFGVTGAVHASLAVMMGHRRRRRFLAGAAFHAVLVLLLIVLAAAVIVVPPLWKGLALLPLHVPRPPQPARGAMADVFIEGGLAAIVFVGALGSYRYLAPVRVPWPRAAGGAAGVTAMLFALKGGASLYVRRASRLSLIYGSLFRVVSFIIVTYLFAAAYLYCASVIGMLHRDGGEGEPLSEEGTGAGEGRAPCGD